MFSSVTIQATDVIAVIALVLAGATFYIHLRDRAPRFKVNIGGSEVEDRSGEGPDRIFMWVDIVNHSSHRLKGNTIWIEWGNVRWPTLRWHSEVFPGLQVAERDATYGTSRFWVEPWGDATFTADFEELPYDLVPRPRPGMKWLRVAVVDSRGKRTHSNKLPFRAPSHAI